MVRVSAKRRTTAATRRTSFAETPQWHQGALRRPKAREGLHQARALPAPNRERDAPQASAPPPRRASWEGRGGWAALRGLSSRSNLGFNVGPTRLAQGGCAISGG